MATPALAREQALARQLPGLPHVTGVAFAATAPVQHLEAELIGAAGQPRAVDANDVSPEYFQVLGIRLLVGRGLAASDGDCHAAVCSAVVSRAFQRRWGAPKLTAPTPFAGRSSDRTRYQRLSRRRPSRLPA